MLPFCFCGILNEKRTAAPSLLRVAGVEVKQSLLRTAVL